MEHYRDITYERLSNGIDLCCVPTQAQDIVVLQMAFPGGVYATYNKQTVTALLSETMPTGTRGRKRLEVRELFETLGARVSVTEGAEHLRVSLACRNVVFAEAFALLLDILCAPQITEKEFAEAVAHLDTALLHTEEDTRLQARIATTNLLYEKGHPHWIQHPRDMRKELDTTRSADLTDFHKSTFSGVGAVVCIAGDIRDIQKCKILEESLLRVPDVRPTRIPTVHVDRTRESAERDVIISLQDKMNVDTLFSIPLAITRDHPAYQALAVGVNVLGGSFTGRLFASLRTKHNLTYGSYAGLSGMGDGYPGYLSATAIFPHDVFLRGRIVLRDEVRAWAEKGITAKELERRKEEIAGSYKVGLATTSSLCDVTFNALLNKRGLEYVDNYPKIIQALTLREVNTAIKEHVHYDLAVTASAGAVDEKGMPLR